jgi:transcriptional repressor NrdR
MYVSPILLVGDFKVVVKVVKRDGSAEEFAREKLVTSLLKAGSDLRTAREVADRVERHFAGRNEVKSEEIRSKVLELLKEKDVKLYENWVVYDRAVKRRL